MTRRPWSTAPSRGLHAARRVAQLAVTVLVVSLGAVSVAAPASADTAPTDPDTPVTASARPLPTWQVNGVAWSQVIVGNTVYVTGSFPTARPPGVPVGGAGQVSVGNIMAYDIRTGNRISSFSHTLNGQGRTIAASPDGSRIYVGGDFTTVDGQPRGHIAAFDVATGALVSSFNPSTNGRVQAITVSGSRVYFGGSFSSVGGVGRSNLAAVSTANNSLTSWSPGTDGNVWAMVLTPAQDRVVIGGQFELLNGQDVYGHGAVDATTGASGTWLANDRIRDAVNGAIGSLTTDGELIYGTGWAFGAGATFEGVFAANPDDGSIHWVNDCLGDAYDAAAIGDVVYTVGHAHDCSVIPTGFPDTNPRVRWQRSLAFTKDATGVNQRPDVYGWDYTGLPASSILHWFPSWAAGSASGQWQAGWNVRSTSQYVAVAGEFPYVNNTAQQGLTRFGIGATADKRMGPTYTTNPPRDTPSTTAGVVRPNTVRVAFGSAWDKDNETLGYQVLRDGQAVGDPVLSPSNFWSLPSLAVTDTDAPAGKHTYRVRITDPDGNSMLSPVSNEVEVSDTIGAYGDAVLADSPDHFWRLGEPSGTLGLDSGDAPSDLTVRSGLTWGAAGIVDDSSAATVDGTQAGGGATTSEQPAPNVFSVEAWFKTSSTQGGKIVGYGNSSTGASTSYDRHVYMTNDGRLTFGVYTGATRTITSGDSYNDGEWHQVVASLDGNGLRMYVDGLLVGKSTAATSGQDYAGYWSIGGDNLNGWPDRPSSDSFSGTVDEVAVYPTPLTVAQLREHYTASGRTVDVPPAPTDAYGSAVYEAAPELYWRLDETTGTRVVDQMGVNDGGYTGGYTLGQDGATGPGTSVGFDGSTGNAATSSTFANPTAYSEELWFNTTTTAGGKLIGFAASPTGRSSSYDRHVWMRDDGTLAFGVWTGQTNIAASTESFNDGEWHHLVATQGTGGMALYVDGVLVGTNPQTSAQAYTGYWRIGGDTTWGGASSDWFSGRLDEVAVYSRTLTQSEVADHFTAAGGELPNQLPTASFSTDVAGKAITVDGSGSSDPDGSIESYAWDFGDGETATGADAQHTYGLAGDYTVELTVTDDRGDTATSSQQVTVTNAAPSAAFTSSVDALTVSLDGSWSTDPDGGVTAYEWDFGDGSTGTGETAEHTYDDPGTYTVELTVTDTDGATDTTTDEVTVALNQAPTASFVEDVDGLTVSLDGSGSDDPDGVVASYAWDFGDGSTASGATAEHTYGSGGSYTVELTVTDDEGASDTTTKEVTVTEPPAGPLAADTFSRTVTGGLGTADTGGDWNRSGSSSLFGVSDGVGTMRMSAAGRGAAAGLPDVSSTDTDLTLDLSFDKAGTGGGIYSYVTARGTLSSGYRTKMRITSSGAVQAWVTAVDGSETTLDSATVPGVTFGAGDTLSVRMQTYGVSPTTVRAKIWPKGTAEPGSWLLSATDSTPSLQAAGGIAVRCYLSGSANNAPVVMSFDDLLARPTGL